jgi:hypothetical protein
MRKAAKTTAEQEMEHQERAMAMTKMMLNDALRAKKAMDNTPPSPKKRTIIIPD